MANAVHGSSITKPFGTSTVWFPRRFYPSSIEAFCNYIINFLGKKARLCIAIFMLLRTRESLEYCNKAYSVLLNLNVLHNFPMIFCCCWCYESVSLTISVSDQTSIFHKESISSNKKVSLAWLGSPSYHNS